ncbi:MAG: hypothetical protein NC123_17495 [Butyrivibrio sp.]|nr:hypothetical protein [Acetatifactor muris]MCM1561311.1 hypothetical protein [Butyrivibrio sp.]
MRMKKCKVGLAAAVLCLGLAGCGENAIPELTDQEMQTVGEYAAFIMMKYDASNRSRLVTLPPEAEPTVPDPVETAPPQETEEPSGMGEVDNTPVTDVSQQEDPGSMEDVLGLAEGVSAGYVDAEICDTYPHDEEFGGIVVSASEGKKLLVLRFRFTNGTEQEQTVDIISQKELTFRITVNESYKRNALPVLVPDDMTALKETIPAGESTEAVLIIEVEQGSMEEISTLSLNLKNDAKTYTIQLK